MGETENRIKGHVSLSQTQLDSETENKKRMWKEKFSPYASKSPRTGDSLTTDSRGKPSACATGDLSPGFRAKFPIS